MFGIGGGEFVFIIFIALMFFGADKIPEMARTLGKGMAQLKNATNDIKSEIHNSVRENGIDVNALTGGISEEINKAKEGFSKMVQESSDKSGIKSELDQIRENFAQLNQANGIQPQIENKIPEITDIAAEVNEGPIKRQG